MGTLMKMGSLVESPQRSEYNRLIRVILENAGLPGSHVGAVEQSIYFPSGSSPVHAEVPTEEVIYFRRGQGKVLVGSEYVDVRPGSAVAIPSGVEHHVLNSGDDILEHILISANIGDKPVDSGYVRQAEDLLSEAESRSLSRLKCRAYEAAIGQSLPEFCFDTRESVYSISSGFGVMHVKLIDTDYEWQYPVDSSSCVWVPPQVPHSFRNIGDSPLRIIQFGCTA